MKTMRYGLRTQPAPLVRDSSRRIMSMRFRPANISVINRRASSEAVIGPAVQNPLKAHQRDHVPAPPPVEAVSMPERCSPSRVRFAAPNYGAPLTAARRSGQAIIATGGSGGNMKSPCANTKNQNLVPESLTRSLHISYLVDVAVNRPNVKKRIVGKSMTVSYFYSRKVRGRCHAAGSTAPEK